MNNYSPLCEKLNQMFPERLELKFGCFIRRFQNSEPDMLLKIAAGTSEHSVYLASGRDGMPLELHGLSTQDIEAFEILGQRITVADVLRAFEKIGYHAQIECDGQFYAYEDITEFNLSLPLSHPSQDEACGKVLSLLTNNKDNE